MVLRVFVCLSICLSGCSARPLDSTSFSLFASSHFLSSPLPTFSLCVLPFSLFASSHLLFYSSHFLSPHLPIFSLRVFPFSLLLFPFSFSASSHFFSILVFPFSPLHTRKGSRDLVIMVFFVVVFIYQDALRSVCVSVCLLLVCLSLSVRPVAGGTPVNQ